MNKAQYLSTSPGGLGNGLYPLSIQGLDFIQQQILALEAIAAIAGRNYTLYYPYKDSDGAEHNGFIVVDGELLPSEYTPDPQKANAIRINQSKEDINADGVTYTEARIRRWVTYESKYIEGQNRSAFDFPLVQTNAQLAAKLPSHAAMESMLSLKLSIISTARLTRTQLDRQTDNVRILCRKGSIVLNGAEEYAINVYRHSAENITQEQILPDMRRYARYWDASAKKWSAFFPVTENLHIDVKIVGRTTVYIRHGFIPEGVQLVLLRKKKRGRKRRSGGGHEINPEWVGRVALRQPKNQYVHYRGVILSTSSPNKWYVPKCIGVTDKSDNYLIGKELGKICAPMIVAYGNGVPGVEEANKTFKVIGTRIRASRKGTHANTQATCYARIALQFAPAGATFKGAGGEMARMKYRLWFHLDKETGKTTVMRGFSYD